MSRPARPREVVIVQRRLKHYREPLFEQMRSRLAAQGITLRLLYGQVPPAEQAKQDAGHLDWAEPLPARYLLGGKAVWHNFGPAARGADLVVVTQENKLLYNLVALFLARPRRLAYWGHGRNMQSDAHDGARERFKRWLAVKVDWWFGYTELTRGLVRGYGFADERITVLDNAVDTRHIRELAQAVTGERLQARRLALGLDEGPVLAFVGSLYDDKRLPFLVQAADRLRERVPGLQLVLVGDGPLRAQMQAAAASRPWLKVTGALFDADKVEVLSLARLLLNPGLVGLGILDAFATGTPMVTTDCGIHSPEISYLDSGVNGLMTADDLDTYVQAVAGLLNDPARLDAMAREARAASDRYTIENMAERFCDGIERCLAMPA